MTTAINRNATEKRSQQLASSTAARQLLQRKCACGGSPGPSGECEKCREKRLQRKVGDKQSEMQNRSSVPPIVHEVLHSSAHPLDTITRDYFESRFGHDFSQVRIHTDVRAAESAEAVNALAYTIGPEIVFDSGQYAPGSRSGRELLAHELAHVLQQRAGVSTALVTISEASSPAEAEADAIGKLVGSGEPIAAVRQAPDPGVIARAAQSGTTPGQRPQQLQFDILGAEMSVQDPIARAAAVAIGADMRVTSLDDMITKLEARAGPTTGACVQRISIWNHGKPGLQVVAGEKPVCVRDPGAPATQDCGAGYRPMRFFPRSGFDLEWLLSPGHQAALSRLRGVFCCGATMEWLGCSIAGVEASGGLRSTAEQRGSGLQGSEAAEAPARFGEYGYRYQSIQDALAHGASTLGAVFGLETVQAWADGTCTTITASNDFTFFDPAQPRQLHRVGYGGGQTVTPPTGPGQCSCDATTGRVTGSFSPEQEKRRIQIQERAQTGSDYLWHVHLRLFRELLGYGNLGQYRNQIEQTLQLLIEDVVPRITIPSGLPTGAIAPWLELGTGVTRSARVMPHLALCFPDNCWRWIQVNARAIQTTPEYTQLVLEHELTHASDIWTAAQAYRSSHGNPPGSAGSRCVPVGTEDEIRHWTDPWGRYVNDFWDSIPDPAASLHHVEITSAAAAPLFRRFTAVEKARWFQAVLGELPPNLPAAQTFPAEQTIAQLFRDPNPQLLPLREEMAHRLNETAKRYVFGDDAHPADIGRARTVLSHFLPAWQSYLRERQLFLDYLHSSGAH